MREPVIAGDGHTYEKGATEAGCRNIHFAQSLELLCLTCASCQISWSDISSAVLLISSENLGLTAIEAAVRLQGLRQTGRTAVEGDMRATGAFNVHEASYSAQKDVMSGCSASAVQQ